MEKLRSPAPVIRQLDETVVNRIAAGEVVQRPSAAVKEMLENSIDAGSTAITIIAKEGGLAFLQIQDNGHGIRKEDLPILCERFTTSKLRTFEDLKSIATFGFRGEALASITHVAHVTVTTKTNDSPCGYRAKYLDGKLVPLRPGDSAEPRPCAGTTGTTITVEDLFFNIPARRQAFKNPSEQYQRIVDVVSKYSVHFGDKNISFCCKRQGQAVADVQTPSNSSVQNNIRILYGAMVAKELLDLELSVNEDIIAPSSCVVGRLRFQLTGKVSNANYSSKKSSFIVFINHRLVEHAGLKKIAESVYSELLPRHSHPFVYLSFEMPAENVDVNVHPTKREVHFLYEDELLQRVHAKLSQVLQNANHSRTFYTDPSSAGGQTNAFAGIEPTQIDREYEAEGDVVGGANLEVVVPLTQDSQTMCSLSLIATDDSLPPRISESALREHEESSAAFTSDNSSLPLSQHADHEISRRRSKQGGGGIIQAYKMVRTDPTQVRLDSIWTQNTQSAKTESSELFAQLCSCQQAPPPKKRKREADQESSTVEPCVDDTPLVDSTGVASQGNADLLDQFSGDGCLCCGKRQVFNPSDKPDDVANSSSSQNDNTHLRQPPRTSCQYTSIRGIISEFEQRRSEALDTVLKRHSFVGLVDSTSLLLQYQTKLLLIDYSAMMRSMFKQLAIRRFQNTGILQLSPRLSIARIVENALAARMENHNKNLSTSEVADVRAAKSREMVADCTNVLTGKGEMLQEYFNIGIDAEGMLNTLPELLPNHRPSLRGLAVFLLRLAFEVNWEDECECFDGVARELGFLYATLEEIVEESSNAATASSKTSFQRYVLTESSKEQFLSIIYPSLKSCWFLAPEALEGDGSVLQVAALENLYRIFERC